MTVELDHVIVHARDRRASAAFLAAVLGVEVGPPSEPFLPVRVDNGVTLDYLQVDGPVATQHYAFLVDDGVFDAALQRITRDGVGYWAYPGHGRPGEINRRMGGRGVYFDDPDGHSMEILTVSENP
jgi:catechol 2,3-dioxygenase-like lactoylglutathione lyase family enzyme